MSKTRVYIYIDINIYIYIYIYIYKYYTNTHRRKKQPKWEKTLCRHFVGQKLLFPISAQGRASPQENRCCPQIDHNHTVGAKYVYICMDCQSSILSHMVPELINNLICWNCKGCIGKSIGPVQYRFTISTLLAQCHVAGSMPRCWLSAL